MSMYPVSQAFKDAVLADRRRIVARAVIDYTNPEIDQSIQITASEQNRVSYPAQTADAVDQVPYRWASLDGTWRLDTEQWHLAPSPEEAKAYQMGWWGAQLAGTDGSFAPPYPTLIATFLPRPIHSLQVIGDPARGEWPVDFTIRLYDEADLLLYEETVTGNAGVRWSRPLEQSVNQVAKMVLEIRRWSHPGRVAKVVEWSTSVQQEYDADDIIELSVVEEREVGMGTLPTGAISSNEVTLKLRNDDRRFSMDNTQSPLYQLLKKNRRIRVWLGVELPDQTVEWVPMGVYWSIEWQAPDDTVEASVVGRDRMERLGETDYQTSVVRQNVSLYDLAVDVLQDAGLAPGEYDVDPALQSIIVPYAWFEPMSHREALRIIAEAALGVAYCDRTGVVRVVAGSSDLGAEVVADITPDHYFRADSPMRPDQVANEIIVETQPLRPADAPQEVYRSNEPVLVPAGQTVNVVASYTQRPVIDAVASLEGATTTDILTADYYGWGAEVIMYNPGPADEQVTIVITGRPLQVSGQERVIVRDDASILEHGVIRHEVTGNPLIQTRELAQQLAQAILASAKDSTRDIDIDWRGHPALELGDRIRCKGHEWWIISQQIDWAGALSARTTGRRATA